MQLQLTPVFLGIARLSSTDAVPEWALVSKFFSITKTDDELSVVCDQSLVPLGVKFEGGWRCMKVKGPLDFGLTGVLSSLAAPLSEAKISIFAISTFDTDYLLMRNDSVTRAIDVLKEAGHTFIEVDS